MIDVEPYDREDEYLEGENETWEDRYLFGVEELDAMGR